MKSFPVCVFKVRENTRNLGTKIVFYLLSNKSARNVRNNGTLRIFVRILSETFEAKREYA